MCDTLVTFNRKNNRSFFAKNSDREPGELQFVYLSTNPKEEFEKYPYFESKSEYINTSFQTLKSIFDQYESPYSAFISRPIWMWGAEMGINQYGLSIGNEAVFSKEKVKREGLLGMDILRLALHNSKSAKEAVDFIIRIIEEHGQGGDGGYKKPLKYHNSFIIKDFNEAYVLETSSSNWAIKKIEDSTSISNCYTIKTDYDGINQSNAMIRNFKDKYENRLISFFAKGNVRQQFSSNKLLSLSADLPSIKELLRTHINSIENTPFKGMGSICVHSGKLIKSETTSSMIVEYIDDRFVVWFTSSPHPCISIYKPFMFLPQFAEHYNNIEHAIKSGKEATAISKSLSDKYSRFTKEIKPLRDRLELEFERLVYKGLDKNEIDNNNIEFEALFELEKEYRTL